MIEHLHQAPGYPVQLLCEWRQCARSSYYYRPHAREDQATPAAIIAAQGRWPT